MVHNIHTLINTNMKKLFTLFIALAASVGTLFAVNGKCGDNLTWDLTDGVLTISGSGDMAHWEWEEAVPWYSYHESITSVIIGDGVTSIGYIAFYNCTGLTSVTIGNSVTGIGEGAFAACIGLTSVTIPASVTGIGEGAFNGCIGMTNMVVENGNTVYDSRDNCNAIIETASNTLVAGCQNTIIPNSVTGIGTGAFAYCSSLTSIEIPNSVTIIGDGAFGECTGLTSIEIPNSAKKIGGWAFYGCIGLTSVTCKAVVPPTCGADPFAEVEKFIPLYVPENSVNAYQWATGWRDFTNIQGRTFDEAIENPSATFGGSHKLLRDGQLLILRGDKIYTVTGQEVK